MKKLLLMGSVMLSFVTAMAEVGDGARFFKAEVTEPGTLAEVLGERADAIDSLVVEGTINADDFKTLWRSTFYGSVEVINLENAQIDGGIVPEKAFYNFEEQKTEGGESINIIKLRRMMLGDGVEEIGESAFSYALNLKEINLPVSLRKLGNYCFCECRSLSASPLVLPEGVEEVPVRCFMNCRALAEVVLPSTLKRIAREAFYDAGVTAVNFPDGLERIGEAAFFSCDLREALLPESCVELDGAYHFAFNRNMERMHLPDGLTEVPSGIAEECGLVEVNIPLSATKIGSNAFDMCPLGKCLELPEGLTEIGDMGFYGCSGVVEVSFPSTLSLLGKQSCGNWSGVRIIESHAAIPPVCVMGPGRYGPFGLPNENKNSPAINRAGIAQSIEVYVPIGSGQLYREAPGWGDCFYFINESEDVTAILTPEETGFMPHVTVVDSAVLIESSADVAYSVYSVDGKRVVAGMTAGSIVNVPLASGVYVVHVGSVTVKVKL